MNYDPVTRPKHYVEQSAMVEPIDILRFAPFDLGNALKYMIRAGHKDDELQDLLKAAWYLDCATDTLFMGEESPYTDFFRHFLPILHRFGMLKDTDFGMNAATYISDLKYEVGNRIEELKNAR